MQNEISSTELHTLMQQQSPLFLLDVREPLEHAAFNISGHLIPLAQLPQRLAEIPADKPIIVYCRSGRRSEMAVEFLKAHGYKDVKNLVGGMLNWQATVGQL